MVNYAPNDVDMSEDVNVGGSHLGGSIVGGALDSMLNEYDLSQNNAMASGDEYSKNNPTDAYANMMKENSNSANIQKLKKAGSMKSKDVAGVIGKLSNCEHHLLTQTAKHMLKGGGILSGVSTPMALKDITQTHSPSHLMTMVMNDHKIKKADGESEVGGNFLDTLGDVAKGVGPFLPFIL